MFEKLVGRQPQIIGSDRTRHAAVMIPLIKKENVWYVLFEVRSKNLRRQPGEICFPGGRVEAGEDFKSAALREICEELCVDSDKVTIIAPMDVNLSVSGQMVVPYLSTISEYAFTWNKEEVETVFLVPLQYFLDTTPERYTNHVYTQVSKDFPLDKIPGGAAYPWHSGDVDVYFYDVPKRICYAKDKEAICCTKDKVVICCAEDKDAETSAEDVWGIWGLTARIMHAAANIMKMEACDG